MMLADPSLIAHGWPAPGGVLNISTNVTANVSGIPPVTIGYAIINQATGTVLTTQAAAFTLTQGQPAPLSMTIQIPRQALEGKYRAELRVSNGATVLWTDPRSACFTITTAPPPSDGFQIPVRGCSELPSSATNPAMNYVYASGSQIVDANGTPLRISSIGWSGTGGAAGWASDGLWMLNYKRVMESFKSEGFNAIRIPWTDAILYERASQAQSFIDAGFSSNNAELRDPAFPNPDAQGFYTYKKTIDIFQYYADYAAQIGLKIIFEHHSNRGYNGQQQNGLWFSKDLARNYCSDGQYVQGVDGSDASPSATFGRCDSPDSPPSNYVDYATFKQNWVTLAAKFNGHPAVIGFELDNEPGNMWSPCPATGA
ncbi:MAG: cellulase family glycosylhydrolase, partial [Rhodanobacter sp.]|nr:cellulase family glycosylhydrolase [Rhodanobacter sp.]